MLDRNKGGERKEGTHSVCDHQLHQHTCSEKLTWAFLRGWWLLQHASVVAHIAIKKQFELFLGPQLCISQSGEVYPEAESFVNPVTAGNDVSV